MPSSVKISSKRLLLYGKMYNKERIRVFYYPLTNVVNIYRSYITIDVIKQRKYNQSKKGKEARKKYFQTSKGKYSQYKARAKFKNQNFNISFKDFEKLVPSNCYYCGEKSNGLDRINSDKNYTLDNVVSCCKYCNRMKMDMTIEEFRSHIKKIYIYSSRGY